MTKILRKGPDWLTMVGLAQRDILSIGDEIECRRDDRIMERLGLDESHYRPAPFGNKVYRKANGLNINSSQNWIRVDLPGAIFATDDINSHKGIVHFTRNMFSKENLNITRFDYCFDIIGDDPLSLLQTTRPRHTKYKYKSWFSGHYNTQVEGVEIPGTAFAGLKTKMLKVYNKSAEIVNESRNLEKKAYYLNKFKNAPILRVELSIRSKDYFDNNEYKEKLLQGKYDEVGKAMMLDYMYRHIRSMPKTMKPAPEYKKLLKIIESL